MTPLQVKGEREDREYEWAQVQDQLRLRAKQVAQVVPMVVGQPHVEGPGKGEGAEAKWVVYAWMGLATLSITEKDA